MKKRYPLLLMGSATLLLSVLIFSSLYTGNSFGYSAEFVDDEDFEDATYIDTFDGINVDNSQCWRANEQGASGSGWSWRVNVSKICVVDISNSSMRMTFFSAKYFNKGNNHTVSILDINNVTLKSKYYNNRSDYDVWDSENTDWVYISYNEQQHSIGTYPHYLKIEVYDDGYDALWLDNATISYSLIHQFELRLYPNLDVDPDPPINITNSLVTTAQTTPAFNTSNTFNNTVSSDTINNTTNTFNFGVYKDLLANTTNYKDIAVDTTPDFTIVNLFLLEASGSGGCTIDGITLLNSYGGEWVFAGEKYYNFFVQYSAVNLTANPLTTIGFQMTDGLHNMTVQYHHATGIFEIISSPDSFRVPRNNASGWIEYSPSTLKLNVTYPIYFTDVKDTLLANASAWCDGIWSDLNDFTFKIYNQGGLIEYSTLGALGGSASFTDGGDWMEGCVEYYGIIQANQTWRKLQSIQLQYSVKFYENSTGTFTPEDQFMQHGQNSGGGAEKYGGVADYHIRWKIHAWDNVTQAWIQIGYIDSWMIDGDEGASDEWTSIKSAIYEGVTEQTNSTWNAFIEEESASKYRLWMDIWLNKINGSSVMGFRNNPYYYGMDDRGYMFWTTWAPQLDNGTATQGFINLKDGNGLTTVSSQFDLFKLEFEMEMTANGGSGEPYRVCVEDVNVAEINMADRGAILYGTDTPSPNKPITVEMGQGGLLAPLYNLLKGIGDQIWKALSSAGGLIWDAIGDRFPWFTDFFEGLTDFLAGGSVIFTTLFGYIINLINFGAGLVDYIAQPISVITGTWDFLVEHTAIFFEADPVAVSQVLILIVIFIPAMEALSRGDTSYVIRLAEKGWAMADWIFTKFIDIGGRVISWLIEALPI